MADGEVTYYPGIGAGAQDEAPTWGDYAKTAGAGVTGAGAQLAAGARAATDDSPTDEGHVVNGMATALQGYLNHATDDIEGSRTDSAKRLAASAITSKEFWEHPVSAGALKLSGMSGPAAAMIFSGGPIGAAIVNGSLTAGSYLNDVDKMLDGMSSGDLEQNKYYSTLRSMGMDESEARLGLKKKLVDNKTMYNFLAGAAAGAIGPAGKLASGVSGKAAAGLADAETGVAARAALGGAEGAAGGALQGGVANATLQQTEIDAGKKKSFDQDALVNAVLEPAALGGVMGAAAGAAVKPKSKTKPATEEAPDGPAEAQVPPEQGGGAKDASVEAQAPAGPQGAPDSVSAAPAQVPGAKGQAIKNKKGAKAKAAAPEITVVDAAAPSPEQALAMAPATPPDVVAASKRIAEPAPPEAPTAPAEPAAVPPDVAAASQRVAQPEPAPVTPEVTAPEQPPVSSVAAPSEAPAPVEAPKRAPQVLKNLTEDGLSPEEVAPTKIEPLVEAKVDDQGNKVVPGRNMGPKARERVAAHRAASDTIVGAHPATDAEANYVGDKTAQAAVVSRAQAMVAAADAAEHKIPAQIKPSANKDQISDHPPTQMLVYARDLARAAKSKAKGAKLADAVLRFKEREDGVKSGNAAEEVSKRQAEGEAAMRRDQGDAGERGATTDTPESILAAKEGVEVASTDDAKDEAKATAAAGEIDAEKNAVETSVSGSSKGKVRSIDDATEKRVIKAKDGTTKEVEATKAASDVKKVTVGDDMKAKYAAMLEKASKKTGYLDPAMSDKQTAKDAKTGEPVNIIKTMTAKKALEALDLSHLSGVPHALAKFAQRRFAAMVGDSPVHIVDKAEMARIQGDLGIALQNDGKGDIGLHRVSMTGEGGFTAIRHDALHTPEQTAHVVIHEITHAATMRAIHENPEIHKTIENMMGEVRDFAKSLPEDIRGKLDYAMTNTREFIAEAFSNPDVQEILTHIPLSPALAAKLRMERTQRLSVWDAMVNVVRGIIEKTTGRLPEGHRMIEGVMRMGEHIDAENVRQKLRERDAGGPTPINLHGLEDGAHLNSKLSIKEAGQEAVDRLTNTRGTLRRLKHRMATTFMIKEGNGERMGPGLEKAFDWRAQMEREKDKILATHGGAEVVRQIAELERSNPEGMAAGSDLIFDASNHNVNLGPGADNSHLGKNATKGWQGKKALAKLQKRYDALAPEVQAMLQKSVKFFRDIHNEVSMATIKNVLEVAGINEAGLADRIFKDGVTEADRAKYGEKSGVVSALNAATNLKELKGWYAPFRRYGDFISTGEHELSVPKNATKINDNTIQFYDKNKAANARAVKAYVEQDSHTPQGNQLKNTAIEKVYIDPADPTKLLDKSDVNSVQAYRVRMQTQHTEFHATEAEANANQVELDQAGLKNTSVTMRDSAHRTSPGVEGALGSVIRSLEHNAKYNQMEPSQKQAVKQSLMEASVRSMSSTNIKTSMAQRQNVAGMSHDLGRVTADYARMTANYLAGLRFKPKIDAAFAEMRAFMKAHQYDGERLKRQEIYDEMSDRTYGNASVMNDRAPNPVVRKLLQVSRLARLAGVSFHVINSMEPWTTSLPMIAGRHGAGQSMKALAKAYNTIGGLGAIRAGLADTGRAYTRDNGFTDYVQMFKDNIAKSNSMGGAHSKFLMDTLDYANSRNLWGNDAIFEVGKSADPSGNIAARALDRADLMANQVGAAVEGNNRAVTLLAAAQLELKRNGGNHEAAMAYAYKTAVETMGDYSSWNASPLFNTRAGQMTLQFKKFAQKSYYMLGKTIKGTLQGDPESAKQFVGLMVTHGLVAGALGLPGLEPFKVALMASNAIGLTGYDPGDFDNDVRQLAARVFGSKGGEMVSHGVFRGMGIEVSNRLGWDNLLTYGNPKTNKLNDIKSWLFDTMAGAPAAYLLDQVSTAQALMKGDIGTAIQKASPIRAVGDVAKAVSGAMGPKLSPTGVKQHAALTPYQAGVRALGFTPSATAEDGAMRGSVASDTKKLTGDRSGLVNGWVNAKPSGKAAAWRAVQQWNRGEPKDAQIQMKDLTNAAKRRTDGEAKGTSKNGIQITKRTKQIYAGAARTYNP